MTHLATATVGRQTVGDGSLQSPGETLLPRFPMGGNTFNVYQGWPTVCHERQQSAGFHSNQRPYQLINTSFNRGKRLYIILPAEVTSLNANLQTDCFPYTRAMHMAGHSCNQ